MNRMEWLSTLLAIDIIITIFVFWWGWNQKRLAVKRSAEATELQQEVHEASLKIVELEMSATSDTVEAAMDSLMQESTLQKQMIVELREANVVLNDELNSMTQEMRKQKGRAASAHTQRGQLLEKWTPFLNHPPLSGLYTHLRPSLLHPAWNRTPHQHCLLLSSVTGPCS